MPKSGKKGAKKNNCENAFDVKLSDFANSSARAGRLKKSVPSVLDKEESIQSIEDDVLWFERDLDEFQFLQIKCDHKKKPRSKPINPVESLNGPGIRYPIDVWFLVGQYIKPEDVKLFATLCKDSYQVSRSYSFWLNMYKRYYCPKDSLPTRLQPECIDQAYCLKTSVIRALYQMYPQFEVQLSSRMYTSDVYSLSNLCCTGMWRIQEKGKWVFHFKFQHPTCTTDSDDPLTYQIVITDIWASTDAGSKNQDRYVNHNPDEGCKILRFSCSHFVAVPPIVMGSRLADVRINLAHDMRRQKMQLTFRHSSYTQSYNKSNCMNKESGGYNDVVEFDAIENLIILNWWHPQYPLECNV